MARDLVHNLKYLGVIPQTGYVEYGFRIENKDKDTRLVILEINSDVFRRNELMFQEGPDLCYQKVLADLGDETAESPIAERVPVTASDIARYRELHPATKTRKSAAKKKIS
jgi:hypothetical protein